MPPKRERMRLCDTGSARACVGSGSAGGCSRRAGLERGYVVGGQLKTFGQSGLFQHLVSCMAALDANRDRKTRPCYRAVINWMSTVSHPRAIGPAKNFMQISIVTVSHLGRAQFLDLIRYKRKPRSRHVGVWHVESHKFWD